MGLGLGIGAPRNELAGPHGVEHVAIDTLCHDGIAFIAGLVLGVRAVDNANLLYLRHQFLKLLDVRLGEFLRRIDLHHACRIEAQTVDQAVLDAADERRHGDNRGDADDNAQDGEQAAPLVGFERVKGFLDEIAGAHATTPFGGLAEAEIMGRLSTALRRVRGACGIYAPS